MVRFGIPMAPILFGLGLSSIIENNLRYALVDHNMDLGAFITKTNRALLLGIGTTISRLVKREVPGKI